MSSKIPFLPCNSVTNQGVILIKQSMTSFDVFAVVHELKELEGARLNNIYQIGSIYLFVFHKFGQEKQVLLIEPEIRAHLTRFEMQKPKSPPNFCLALRRHLRGARVVQFFQPNFDRIIGMRLERGGEVLKVVVELFKRGNLIVIREDGRILMAIHYRKMRDRNILPGKPFQYPPLAGRDIFSLTKEDLKDLLEKSELDVVRTLANTLNIGGTYAEELIHRANITKDQLAASLTETNLENLWVALTTLITRLKATPPDLAPTLVYRNTQLIDITPFPLDRYTHSIPPSKSQARATMNEALDDFFIEYEKGQESTALKIPRKKVVEEEETDQHRIKQRKKEESRLKRQLEKQERRLEELYEQTEQTNRLGSLLLKNLLILEEITSTILGARKNGQDWNEINKKIQEGRERGIEGARLIQKLEPGLGMVVVKIEGTLIKLDFTQKVSMIAQQYFARSHKMRTKIEGTKKAIEDTKKLLERTRKELTEVSRKGVIKASTIIERRKRYWFEKFRWFRSSDDFLVIAGRDAHTNEAIVKRYMKKGDIFVHATVHGAPHTVILAEGEEVPLTTLQEAGQFATSFSSAWKAGVGSVDAYYVNPEQVSFSPPSGEYLVRGGVIVRGKRNSLKGMVLETAIGIIIEEKFARVIGGPPDAVKAKTDYYVALKPGDETRGSIAKQIKAILAKKVPEQEKEKIFLLDLNEFFHFIPGRSKIQDSKDKK